MNRLASAIEAQHRRARWRRAAGFALIVAGAGLLLRPLTQALASGGDAVSLTAGVLAAALGSLLLVWG